MENIAFPAVSRQYFPLDAEKFFPMSAHTAASPLILVGSPRFSRYLVGRAIPQKAKSRKVQKALRDLVGFLLGAEGERCPFGLILWLTT